MLSPLRRANSRRRPIGSSSKTDQIENVGGLIGPHPPQKRSLANGPRRQSQAVPAVLATPTDFGANATRDIAATLNVLLADVFALYLKTKNVHWHMSGPHFCDYHLMLDEQSDEIFAMTDALAERLRKSAT
jgi:hypothetical protein